MALLKFAFRVLDKLERESAYYQGKGYGRDSVDKEVAVALRVLGRRPSLVIDIGGNVGKYALEVRRRAPECEIHVFEPAAKNVAILTKLFDGDRLVHVNPLAVSDVTQETVLFANEPGSTLGSLTRRRLDHFGMAMDHNETVKTVRFEDYYQAHLRDREIDLLKLDIEGHELAALRGMGDSVLRRTRCVQFEFGGPNIDTRTFLQDFFYFFSQRQFEMFRITPLGPQHVPVYREADEYFSTANYLARNRNLV